MASGMPSMYMLQGGRVEPAEDMPECTGAPATAAVLTRHCVTRDLRASCTCCCCCCTLAGLRVASDCWPLGGGVLADLRVEELLLVKLLLLPTPSRPLFVLLAPPLAPPCLALGSGGGALLAVAVVPKRIVMDTVTMAVAVGLHTVMFMGLLTDLREGGGGRRVTTVLTWGSCTSFR